MVVEVDVVGVVMCSRVVGPELRVLLDLELSLSHQEEANCAEELPQLVASFDEVVEDLRVGYSV